jgi:hypothetical protein
MTRRKRESRRSGATRDIGTRLRANCCHLATNWRAIWGRGILHWLLGVPRDRRAILILALASTVSTAAFAETLSPEADACKASGLIALKQRSPQVKDIEIDLDSAKIINADTKIEDVPIKTVVIGEAYIERAKSAKPQTFVCIIGDKGKVLLTLFSDK